MKFVFAVCLIYASCAQAEVHLPALLSDHAILQSGIPVRIWGWADPGEPIEVSFQNQTLKTVTSPQGRWEVFLKPLTQTDRSSDLSLTGSNHVVVHDLVVGDVWVASGQSNMAFAMSSTRNAAQEISQADDRLMRFFIVKQSISDHALDDVQGKWEICTPDTVRRFSAVAYFFARELRQHVHMPIGVIGSYWGGTPAQSWTSADAMQDNPALDYVATEWKGVLERYPDAKAKFDEAIAKWNIDKQGAQPRAPLGPDSHNSPGCLYNAMVAPLTPFAIRGVIWYQGEANASEYHAYRYRWLFETQIRNWRDKWGIGPFPFYYVQLANYRSNGWWPLLRDSQSNVLNLRNTAMAVTIDIGNPDNIHPTDKQDVGHRLALAARAQLLHEDVEYSGPVYRQMTIEGSGIRLWFDHANGLAARDGGDLLGFEIAGPVGEYFPARGRIEAGTVVVSGDAVANPTRVRYAWSDDPQANLVNQDGLPAAPFRTETSRSK